MSLKVIFLDIDGVLNVIPHGHDEFGGLFHPNFENNLKRIVDETEAKIVISSSWRKSGLEVMKELWEHRKLAGEIIDCTPSLYLKRGGCIEFWNDKLSQHPTPPVQGYSIPRGCEIDYWIRNESDAFGKLINYVILDDDTDMLLHQKDYFVQCSDNIKDDDCIDIGYGLTNNCTEKAINILKSLELSIN